MFIHECLHFLSFFPLASVHEYSWVFYSKGVKDAFSDSTLMLKSIEESGVRQRIAQRREYYPCLSALCSTDTEGKLLWTDGMKGNQV